MTWTPFGSELPVVHSYENRPVEPFATIGEMNAILVVSLLSLHHQFNSDGLSIVVDFPQSPIVEIGISTYTSKLFWWGTSTGGGGPETRRPEYNWRFNKAKGGGSSYDLGCYCIHHARFIFDAEPVRVFAAKQPGIEVDDAAYLLLVFPGDRTAQISVGFNASGGQYAEISGRAGSANRIVSLHRLPERLRHGEYEFNDPDHASAVDRQRQSLLRSIGDASEIDTQLKNLLRSSDDWFVVGWSYRFFRRVELVETFPKPDEVQREIKAIKAEMK